MKVDAGKIVELVRKMKPLFADSSRVSTGTVYGRRAG